MLRNINGFVKMELTTPDIPGVLAAITQTGVHLRDIVCRDELHVVFCIKHWDVNSVRKIAEKHGCDITVVSRTGIRWFLKDMRKRPVLLIWLLLQVALVLYLPSRILFIEVQGNELLSREEILSAAEHCGIKFGSSRRLVRSEKVKNELLEQLGQLQWAAVNTSGCVAVVSVREREMPQSYALDNIVSSIVAATDGVIAEFTVEQGTSLCRVGQAVLTGDVLISGYTDCDLTIRADRAKGEIYAFTKREESVLAPREFSVRELLQRKMTNIYINFGKKRINFYKGSGISDSRCAKIYEEYTLRLPGGYTLPITVGMETVSYFTDNVKAISESHIYNVMESASIDHVKSKMISGDILNMETQVASDETCYQYSCRFFCREMIGRERIEESIN